MRSIKSRCGKRLARGDFALTSDALVLAVRDSHSSTSANATPATPGQEQEMGASGGGDAGEVVAVVELCLRQPEGFLPFQMLFNVRITCSLRNSSTRRVITSSGRQSPPKEPAWRLLICINGILTTFYCVDSVCFMRSTAATPTRPPEPRHGVRSSVGISETVHCTLTLVHYLNKHFHNHECAPPPHHPPFPESRQRGGSHTCATLPLPRSTEGTDTESSWCFFARAWRKPIGGEWSSHMRQQ